MSSRSRAGGSRYPSAYGHTPSYRSYNSLGGGGLTSSSSSYASSPYSSSSLRSDLLRDSKVTFDDKLGFDTGLASSSLLDKTFDSAFDLGNYSGNGGLTSSSSKKMTSKSYSSSYSSSSDGKKAPVVEYSTDSTYRSSATGPSGIPHSSYSHSSSNYSSESPYKNRVSSYSYNI